MGNTIEDKVNGTTCTPCYPYVPSTPSNNPPFDLPTTILGIPDDIPTTPYIPIDLFTPYITSTTTTSTTSTTSTTPSPIVIITTTTNPPCFDGCNSLNF